MQIGKGAGRYKDWERNGGGGGGMQVGEQTEAPRGVGMGRPLWTIQQTWLGAVSFCTSLVQETGAEMSLALCPLVS